MLAGCANPGCAAEFEYLHQGRVFLVRDGTGKACDIDPATEFVGRVPGIRYLWLCDRCSRQLTVVYQNGEFQLIPKLRPAPATKAAVKTRSAPPSGRRRKLALQAGNRKDSAALERGPL